MGNTLPIVLSSTALLSVMVYWGDHPGFHCLRIVRPSAIMSSFSNCGIIVAMIFYYLFIINFLL